MAPRSTPTPTPPDASIDADSAGSDPARPRGAFAVLVPFTRVFRTLPLDGVVILGITIFLVLFGLVMVLSASTVDGGAEADPFARVLRQGMWAAIGLPLMLVVSKVPTTWWRKLAWPAFGLAVVLQLLVFVPGLSYDYGGNTNWIAIGGFTMQPSEFVKLALIVWVAQVLTVKQRHLDHTGHVLFPAALGAAILIGLVLLGNDLGTVMIMVLVFLTCLYVAGVRLRLLVGIVIVLAIAAVIVAQTSPSRVRRITAWWNGCSAEDYAGYCWQSQHGTWALANGGVFGVGLGNSKTKWNWLPHADSDYIFAIIGEEFGLIGAAVVLALFITLAVFFIRAIRSFDNLFARIVTGGVMMWIVGQALVNIAVVLGLLPVLGVPLPFISSGGTALLSSLLAIGVVLALLRDQATRDAMPTRAPSESATIGS